MDKFISQTDSSLKKKKRRWKPKGRQAENNYFEEVSNLFQGISFKRDELIEYLHILQDKFGVLYDKQLTSQTFAYSYNIKRLISLSIFNYIKMCVKCCNFIYL